MAVQIVSTEASPPPEISFLYFLAGLFGMLLTALFVACHPEALLNRWLPATLASVHLFALGGLMPVMLGALFQFVPVACGISVQRATRTDVFILLALQGGAITLACGLFTAERNVLLSAAALLIAALGIAAVRLLRAFWSQKTSADLQRGMRMNVLSFCAVFLLGLTLIGTLTEGWALPLKPLIDWHAQWGLIGWLGGLIATVASIVVPMFLVSNAYPQPLMRALRSLPLVLLLTGVAASFGPTAALTFMTMALCLVGLIFAMVTIHRTWSSRRGGHDAFQWGWLSVGLLCAALSLLGATAYFSTDPRFSLAFGVLALAGLGGGTISVMLYRIVPFLSWLHWQRVNKARVRLPLLHRIINERVQQTQLVLEAVALILLTCAAFFPELARSAALLLATSKLCQLLAIAKAVAHYRKKRLELLQMPAAVRA